MCTKKFAVCLPMTDLLIKYIKTFNNGSNVQ